MPKLAGGCGPVKPVLFYGVFFPSRSRRGPDRYMPWKAAALLIGAVLVLAGGRLAWPWAVWAGIAVLAVGFMLRFLPQRRAGDTNDQEQP